MAAVTPSSRLTGRPGKTISSSVTTPAEEPSRVTPLRWEHLKWLFIIGLATLIASAAIATFGRHRLDHPITLFINRAAGSDLLDDVSRALWLYTLMGVVLMAGIWLIWFDAPNPTSRVGIAAGVIAASFAGLCSRVLQLILPMHLRPLQGKAIPFVVPQWVDPNMLNHWNSFPSDTSTALFGLALVIFIFRPIVGIAALLWGAMCALSRVFGGLHFLSDVTGGAGVAMVCASQHRACLVFPR